MSALTVATSPTLRRLPIPLAEPRPALRVVPEPSPGVPEAQGVLILVGTDPGRAGPGTASPAGEPVTPPAGAWTRQFVQAALEVSAGRRPVSQLVRWTSEEVFAMLSRRAALAQRLERPGGPATSAIVRSIRLCRPTDGVVEACAVTVDRGRVRAVALRLEELAGRWRVSALEIG